MTSPKLYHVFLLFLLFILPYIDEFHQPTRYVVNVTHIVRFLSNCFIFPVYRSHARKRSLHASFSLSLSLLFLSNFVIFLLSQISTFATDTIVSISACLSERALLYMHACMFMNYLRESFCMYVDR